MSGRDDALEPAPARTQEALGDQHVERGARNLDEYPLRLFAPHMAEIYGLSLKRFYALASEGAYDFALIRPQVGRVSWSRERVRQHFAGELRGLTPVRRRA